MKEIGRKATVREVEVEEVVHQGGEKAGGQGGEVHL